MAETVIKKETNNKSRLNVLIPQFKASVKKMHLNASKQLIVDIQPILKKEKKLAKLVELRNMLFELAMELGDFDYAIDGFIANRDLIDKNTRLHLEATALIAICYLRKSDFPKAQPYIMEVLQNKKVIKTDSTRNKFHKEIIHRFDE
jgi:hypothetical protein